MDEYVMAMTTVPDKVHVDIISKAVLEKRLAACVNAIYYVKSHYIWKNEIKNENECILIFKTKKKLIEKLKVAVLSNHPYEVGEFIVLPMIDAGMHYQKWMDDVLG